MLIVGNECPLWCQQILCQYSTCFQFISVNDDRMWRRRTSKVRVANPWVNPCPRSWLYQRPRRFYGGHHAAMATGPPHITALVTFIVPETSDIMMVVALSTPPAWPPPAGVVTPKAPKWVRAMTAMHHATLVRVSQPVFRGSKSSGAKSRHVPGANVAFNHQDALLQKQKQAVLTGNPTTWSLPP